MSATISIKPLEWEVFEGNGQPTEWYARSPCGTFYIEDDGERFAMYSSDGPEVKHYPSKEDAEAAAQAGFAARIRSAIVDAAPHKFATNGPSIVGSDLCTICGRERQGHDDVYHEVIAAAQRIFEVMCGGTVDWAKHADDANEDNLFQSADWECCLAYASAALSGDLAEEEKLDMVRPVPRTFWDFTDEELRAATTQPEGDGR